MPGEIVVPAIATRKRLVDLARLDRATLDHAGQDLLHPGTSKLGGARQLRASLTQDRDPRLA